MNTYLGTGIYNDVPSCCGFKFIPDLEIASITAGIACGNEAIFIIIVLGFFRTIWASSSKVYSLPSKLTCNDSTEPTNK